MSKPSATRFFVAAIVLFLFSLLPAASLAASSQAEILLEKGLLAYDAKKYEQAIEIWSEALALNPAEEKVYFNRGMAWFKMGDMDKAAADFSKAVELDPEYAMAYSTRGFVWKKKGQFDKAKADFISALTANPDLPQPYYQLAWIYALCPDANYRDGDQAIMWAEKAQELKDDTASAMLLAASYAEAGDFPKAIATQKKAIAWLERDGKVYDMDSAQAQLRRYQDSKPLMERPAKEEIAQAFPPSETATAQPMESGFSGETGEPMEETIVDAPEPQPAPAPAPEPVMEKPAPTPVQTAPAPAPAPAVKEAEYSGAAHPWVIQVSAYREAEKSNSTALDIRAKGDIAYTAHASIPEKGEWHRVFVGYFKTKADAQKAADALKARKFKYANILKKPWAISVGDFVNEQALQNMEQALRRKGILAYRMTGDGGSPVRLLVGAYQTPQEAQAMSGEIANAGFPVQVVKR